MKRKTRVRKEWLPKEDGFICGLCKVKGNCSDEKNSTEPFFWDEKAKKITCAKCGHQLTTKKELEDLVDFNEIQQYGFWLRFASEHFIPCDKCQDELHELIMAVNHDLRLEKMSSIVLYKLRQSDYSMWFFKFDFITIGIEYIMPKVFTPCEDCQKKLQEIWEEKELHIGNETKPMVELWRKWEFVEE